MKIRVDWRASVSLTGTICKYLSLALFVPLAVAVVYQRDILVFVVTIVITVTIGLLLERVDPDPELRPREAMLLVALSWFAVAILGAIPYLLATVGTDSSLAHPVNALFESMSGFTTTGATVMDEISTDRYSHALLLWRQMTQWLGGMGIIVLMIAILPKLAVNGAQLIQIESPGPEFQKLTPRIAETARILWAVYFVLTLVLAASLYGLHLVGLAPNMTAYNAVAHSFTTLPTGGFSPEPNSIAAFSAPVQWILIPFMVVAGTNFALFWYLVRVEPRRFLENTEFRAYAGVIAVLTGIVGVMLYGGAAPALGELGGTTEGSGESALRHGLFQIVSLLNSTGFATSDFAAWDSTAQFMLLTAMFVGGSAGSTGGGIKIIRWLVIWKVARRELVTAAHPEAVKPIRLGGYVIDEDVIRGVLGFTLLYLLVFVAATVFIVLNSARVGSSLTVLEAISASIATIGNIGPGFGTLGPFGSYLEFPMTSKLVMIFLMWIGRLEIIPVLVLFTGAFWKR
ncbi:TrkH family potassium uptake protein [Natronorubrum daqingense]|uniref:Potassium transporter TrkH n=1 Tax=Natronorubrum daqingense TaxID=588898 RepID=A0A1N7DRF0_9EURY|nr:TrkH family potassium uptake protein [Natronorubrum daqingense]APX96126.1 potassium transporter TrkH [Natronorubrum daqingense]SIR78369.1 trk system potassium uptake protein TrkH [Natronorubrum daqingense]